MYGASGSLAGRRAVLPRPAGSRKKPSSAGSTGAAIFSRNPDRIATLNAVTGSFWGETRPRKSHVMTTPDELFGEREDDSLCPAMTSRQNRQNQRGNLCNSHAAAA